jgi:hypothetical protein
VLTAPAGASTAVDWIKTGRSTMPLSYYQGVTHDNKGNLYFDGVFTGLYRTNFKLKQEAGTPNVIDPAAGQNPGFNHIGDLTWDAADGGRIILPLECYDGSKSPSNTCGVGGFAVVDPGTLQWKYWVKLDPRDIPKAMWAEASPDGSTIWTSSGNDLLAYNAEDVTQANAQQPGAEVAAIRPARRLVGAVPAQGITGATFVGSRLFLAGQKGDNFQVSSVDVTTGKARPEIKQTISGESEGLDTFSGLGGTLHWMVMPLPQGGNPPTFEKDKASFLHFKAKATALELVVTPTRTKPGRRTRFSVLVMDNAGKPVKGATVKFAGARVRTNARGTARITATLPKSGSYTASATKKGLKGAKTVVRSSR